MSNPQTELRSDSYLTFEGIACQLANFVGVVAGIGAIPFLRDRLASRFWMVEAGVGALVIIVGLFFLERRSQRLWPLLKRLPELLGGLPTALKRLSNLLRGLPAAIKRLLDLLRSFPAALRRVWEWFLRYLPRQRKAAVEQVPSDNLTVKAALPGAAATAPAPTEKNELVVPYLTLLIGLFVLIPAILVACLHSFWAQNLEPAALGQIAIYFSAPALVIWVIGEIPYVLPMMMLKPWNDAIVTGVLKSGLQVLAAVLLWVFLALSLGEENHSWLLFGGVGLALVGLVLGFVSEAIQLQRRKNWSQNARSVQGAKTAG